MQRKELRQFAVAAVLQLVAAFAGAAAVAKAAPQANGGSGGNKSVSGSGKQQSGAGVDLRLRLLPAVHVLLLWVAEHPELARCITTKL